MEECRSSSTCRTFTWALTMMHSPSHCLPTLGIVARTSWSSRAI